MTCQLGESNGLNENTRVIITEFLRLMEYPPSSDEERNAPQPNAPHGWHQQHQAQTSRETDDVINLDAPSPPNAPTPTPPSANEQPGVPPSTPTAESRRNPQLTFWSMIASPPRPNPVIRIRPSGSRLFHSAAPVRHDVGTSMGGASTSASRAPAGASRSMHWPVPELSQPPLPPSPSADIMSIMAFRRLQRYRTYRRNREMSFAMQPRLAPSIPRSYNMSSGFAPDLERSSILSSVMAHAHTRGPPSPPPPRPPRAGQADADPNDGDDNENEQSEDEVETTQFQRLSPRLPVPAEDPQDNNSDNMEVEETGAESAQEEQAADDGEESEEGGADNTDPEPAQRSANNTPNDLGPSRRFIVDIRRQARAYKRKRESERQRSEAFNLKEFNQNLLRLLECPVCLEWMEPPMLQCRLGHLVCAHCRSRLSSCPVCRSGFSTVRNRAMEDVAELLRYPCRFGCGREARLRRRGAHEASCAARRYRCPAHTCADRAPQPYDELVRHIHRNHAAMIKTGCLHKFSVKVNAQQHDNWLVMAGFGLFHLRIDVDIRTWSVMAYVAYIGPKCRAKEFTYEVTVVGQHNGRKLVYTRATHSDLESSTLNASRQDCFHMTLDEAINYLRFRNRHCQPDRQLEFTLHISKQEVVADTASTISDN